MMVTLMLTGLKLLGHQLARMKLDEKENIVSRFLISTISTGTFSKDFFSQGAVI